MNIVGINYFKMNVQSNGKWKMNARNCVITNHVRKMDITGECDVVADRDCQGGREQLRAVRGHAGEPARGRIAIIILIVIITIEITKP